MTRSDWESDKDKYTQLNLEATLFLDLFKLAEQYNFWRRSEKNLIWKVMFPLNTF